MLTDSEIDALCDYQRFPSVRDAVREAARMTAERCAQICEEQMGYEMEEHAADACAAAIRERVKAPGQ